MGWFCADEDVGVLWGTLEEDVFSEGGVVIDDDWEELSSISVIMKRMFLSVDVFVILNFIFFVIPSVSFIMVGNFFLWFGSPSSMSLSAVVPNIFWPALSDKVTVIEEVGSVIVAISLYLCAWMIWVHRICLYISIFVLRVLSLTWELERWLFRVMDRTSPFLVLVLISYTVDRKLGTNNLKKGTLLWMPLLSKFFPVKESKSIIYLIILIKGRWI